MQMELRNEGPEELLKNQDSSELHSPVNLHLKQLRVKYLYPDDIAATCIEAKTRTNLPEMIRGVFVLVLNVRLIESGTKNCYTGGEASRKLN